MTRTMAVDKSVLLLKSAERTLKLTQNRCILKLANFSDGIDQGLLHQVDS